MNNRRVVTLGVLALGIIIFLCVRVITPDIEKDLLSRSIAALEVNRIPTTGLTFDGRDALLTGVKGSPEVSDTARHLVEDVPGVRVVQVEFIPGQLDPASKLNLSLEKALQKVLQKKPVGFTGAGAVLTPVGRAALDDVFALLAASPGVHVEILGSTLPRTEAVKKYLVAKGIAAGRLTTAVAPGAPIELFVTGGK
jgi:outer membrane protein OmpA-like peptidoglycan-associated protein